MVFFIARKCLWGKDLNELSLFSGAGGGLLGTKLLGWRAVGYVERDAYCQAVLQARIRDGLLDRAPIFGDVRAFLRDGWAERYRGLVDVVTAGFPCQPFSVAGKRLAHADERNLWPETADVLSRVRPRFALLENVPGLASHPYFGTVLGDLAALGFDAEWTVLGADDCGAPHRRKRLWILAYSERDQLRDESGRVGWSCGACTGEPRDDGEARPLADAAELSEREPDHAKRSEPRERARENASGGGRLEDLADAVGCKRDGRADEPGRISEGREVARGHGEGDGGGWWLRDPADEGRESESFVGRVAHGVACRVDRLRAIGNGQVPTVVVRAWHELSARLGA